MQHRYICPYCYIEYTSEEHEEDHQCFDCRAESIDSILLPKTFLLAETSLPELTDAKSAFQSSTVHCRSRKEQIVERIDKLILELPLPSDRP